MFLRRDKACSFLKWKTRLRGLGMNAPPALFECATLGGSLVRPSDFLNRFFRHLSIPY